MPFIGIIAKESDGNFIKNEVTKNAKHSKFEFINVNKESVQNIKNIKFEIIVVNENISLFLKASKYLEVIIQNAKFLIINSDVVQNIESLKELNTNIITYGLNKDAIITMSSVENENLLICIQKSIKNVSNDDIEEQEVRIEIVKNNLKKLCNSLAIFTILVIYGEYMKKI